MTIGLVLVITLVAFETLAVATVLPLVEEELGGLRIYGWAFSGFFLASLVGISWAGGQCDTHGVVRPFVAGLALFAAGLLVAAAAPSMSVLVAGRCIQGLGAGAVPAVVYAVIARAYEDSTRPRLFALMSTAWVVPGLIGPVLAGAVAEYLHWRLVFAGLLPLLVGAAVLTLPALRRVPHDLRPGRESGTARAVQLTLGAGLLLAGITSGQRLVAAGGLVVGAAIAMPALRALLPRGTLRSARGMPTGILGIGLLNLGFFGADAFVPFMLIDVRGQSTLLVGLVLGATTLTWTGGSWVLDRYGGRIERRVFVAAGVLAVALGVVAFIPILSDQVPVWWAVVAWAIAGFGMGMAYPGYSLTVLAAAPRGEEGSAAASLKLNEVLGTAFGAGIVGALVAAGDAGGWQVGSLALSFALMAGVLLVALATSARLGSDDEHRGRSG